MTPIIYPSSVFPEWLRSLLALIRKADESKLCATPWCLPIRFQWDVLRLSLAVTPALLIVGVLCFKPTGKVFADII